MKTPWKCYAPPCRICGNVYFVGTVPASSHLIDTGDGLILIDSGLPQTLYLMMDSMRELGFSPHDIRYILHSHGHYDHAGATRALIELIGSVETYIGTGDEDYVNGKLDLTWARELGYEYHEAFEADHVLQDGDVVSLGNTSIRCLHTPGHTPGTLSFFFDVTDGEHTYHAGMHGGVGMNTMERAFLERYGLPDTGRKAFLEGLNRLRKEPVDIMLGNHVGNNDTVGKAKRVLAGEVGPFIDPAEWPRFLDQCEARLRDLIAKEETK